MLEYIHKSLFSNKNLKNFYGIQDDDQQPVTNLKKKMMKWKNYL